MFTQEITSKINYFENHSHVLEGLAGLIRIAKELHSEERKISLLSVRIVGLLVEQNGAGNCMMNQERFAWHIGLTPNQFWKRAQTYRILKNHPEFGLMIERGETCVSHVSMLAKKITPANAEILQGGLRQKSTREVRDFIASVTPDGMVLNDTETFIDIRLRLTKVQSDLLERAREVLAHGGSVPGNEEIVLRALHDLLERKDPLKKAERAEKTAQKNGGFSSARKKEEEEEEAHGNEKRVETLTSLKKSGAEESCLNNTAARKKVAQERSKIPAAIKHLVWQRDKGYCSHKYPNGTTCGSRMMIEIDHLTPWAKGGTHSPDNLALKCRDHNQQSAVQVFGRDHMEQFWH